MIRTTPPRADEQCFSEATRDESPAAHSVIGVATLAQYRDKQRPPSSPSSNSMSASSSSSSFSMAASTRPFLGNALRNNSLGLPGSSGGGAFVGSPASDGLGKRLLDQQGLRDDVEGTSSDIDEDIGEDIGAGDGGNMSDDEWVPKQLRKGFNAGKKSNSSRRKVGGADIGMGRSGDNPQGRLLPAQIGGVDAAATSHGGSSSSSSSSNGGDVALGTGAGGVSGLTLFSAGDPAAIVRQLRHAFALVQVNSADVILHQRFLYRAPIMVFFKPKNGSHYALSVLFADFIFAAATLFDRPNSRARTAQAWSFRVAQISAMEVLCPLPRPPAAAAAVSRGGAGVRLKGGDWCSTNGPLRPTPPSCTGR